MKVTVNAVESFPRNEHPLHKHGDKVCFVLGSNLLIQVMRPGVFYIFDRAAGEKVRVDVSDTGAVSDITGLRPPGTKPADAPPAPESVVSPSKINIGSLKLK